MKDASEICKSKMKEHLYLELKFKGPLNRFNDDAGFSVFYVNIC